MAVNRISVSGSKGNLNVAFNGEELNSGLNVFETFMLLGGLCRRKAQIVQLDIEEPENPGLWDFFQRGLRAEEVIKQEHIKVLRATEQRIKELEGQIAEGADELNVAYALKAKLNKKVKAARASKKSKK